MELLTKMQAWLRQASGGGEGKRGRGGGRRQPRGRGRGRPTGKEAGPGGRLANSRVWYWKSRTDRQAERPKKRTSARRSRRFSGSVRCAQQPFLAPDPRKFTWQEKERVGPSAAEKQQQPASSAMGPGDVGSPAGLLATAPEALPRSQKGPKDGEAPPVVCARGRFRPFRGKRANGPRTAMGKGWGRGWGHSSPKQRLPRKATQAKILEPWGGKRDGPALAGCGGGG